MRTVVRIGETLVEWTSEGWKTDDPYVSEFCEFVENSGAGGFHWDFSPSKAAAQKLLAACKERNMDAEIVSLAPFRRISRPGFRD